MRISTFTSVLVREIDLTKAAVAVATSPYKRLCQCVFQWGPVDEVCNVSSENELAEKFRKPDDATFSYFFTAQTFYHMGLTFK